MAKPKVLLIEKIHRKGMDYLEKEGCEILFPPAATEEALLKVVPGVDGIVFRTKGHVSRKLIEAAPNLKVVGGMVLGWTMWTWKRPRSWAFGWSALLKQIPSR